MKKGFNPITSVEKYLKGRIIQAWAVIAETNALSFGMGAPNFPAPELIKNATNLAYEDIQKFDDPILHSNLFLNKQIALSKSKQLNLELNPHKNITCQNGADGIVTAYSNAHLKRGDEVILIEPFFTWHPVFYYQGITVKYAKPAFDEENFKYAEFDFDYIRSLITPKTKVILINNPNNPDGRVWLMSELLELAKIIKENPYL